MITDCIVVTKSFESASLLHSFFGRNLAKENTDYWGLTKQDYNKKWVWTIKPTGLIGSSGLDSLKNHIANNPSLKVIIDY